jgi:hypothetical protein
MAIVNVTTANTFNEWRIKTNETGTAVGELTNLTEALTRGTDVVGALTDISTDLKTAEDIIALIPATYVDVVGDTMTGDLNFGDNDKVNFGVGADLEIYHDATDSIIKNSTGITKVQGDDIQILGAAGTETLAKFAKDGAVELYHNNIKKVETTGNGVTVTGGIRISNAGTIGSATTTDAIAIASDGVVTFKDDILIKNAGTIGSATTPDAITIASGGDVSFRKNVIFEGSAADGFETTVAITNPTADRTWTVPNSSDTFVGKATTDTLANKTLNSAILNGTISGAAIKDQDDMSSNSNQHIATQQSIKAYVDAQVTAQDLDFNADTGGTLSIDLDSETLTIAGGTGIGSAGSGNTVTLNIDSTVTTLTGNQTLTNKTLTSAVINGAITGSSIKDEDDMSSNSATHLATQQSIKAYVDNAAESRQDDVGAMISTTIAASAHLAINSGTVYQIINPSGTTQAQWETIGVPSGTTAVKGVVFTALSAAGTGSGTMAKPASSSIQTNVSVAYDDASNVLSFVTPSLLTGDITGNAGTVTVNDTTDTTTFVGLWESASGTLVGKTDAGMTYNAATGVLNISNGLTIGAAVMNETDLEKLDGITNGTAAANKALVLNGTKDIGTLRNLAINGTFTDGNYTFDTSGNVTGLGTISSGAISSSGSITSGGSFIIGSASMSETDLEKLDGITNGTAAASKAVVLDSSRNISNLGTISSGTITTAQIANSTITLNASADIVLNADGGDIFFKDGAATFGSATNNSGNLIIKSGTTTALTMSGANVTVAGDLTVSGTTTTVNSNTVNIGDSIITLNSDEVGTPSENGGIEIERGTSTNTLLVFNESADRWTFTNDGTTYYNIPISTEYNDYALPLATSATRGGAKIGYVESGKNYPVELSSEKMYVNVPWTNTTYSVATTSVLGLIELEDAAVAGTANSVTTTASRTYGLQVNSSNQGAINVPWTNTTYTAGQGLTLTGTVFSNNLEVNQTATENLGLGTNALNSITTGDYNLGIGDDAATRVTTGQGNTAIGQNTLVDNIAGHYNTAVGSGALSNTLGTENTGVGKSALWSLGSGSNNVAIGASANQMMTSGSNTTVIGGNLGGTATLNDTVLIGAGSTERIKVNATGLYINSGALFISNANHTGDVTGASALTIGALKVLTGMIANDQVTEAKMADDSVGSVQMKTLSTLTIYASDGTTVLKTIHGAGA